MHLKLCPQLCIWFYSNCSAFNVIVTYCLLQANAYNCGKNNMTCYTELCFNDIRMP